MRKRIISGLLAAVMAITALPVTADAKISGNQYGDINGDGKVDLRDALILRRHIAGEGPSGFRFENADINGDLSADLADLQILKNYLAEWNIHMGPELLTVSFYDGNRLIDTLPAEKGRPLKEVPAVGKSSKDDAILLGYYTDKGCTQPFYADSPVMGNMNVYAKYQEMSGVREELSLVSFAQMDMSPDLSFEIRRLSGDVAPEDAAVLTVKDGSAPVALRVDGPNGSGIYTVSAPSGFNEGCSYELTLADGWGFEGKDSTIRTAAFSIYMEEVDRLQMSDDIIYIQDTASMDYTVDGQAYPVLGTDQITENGGFFDYAQAASLREDDILCLYAGKHPEERNPENGAEFQDPAAYVKVREINGSQVFFEPLASGDQARLYNIPDNFPIKVDALPTAETGNVRLDALDGEMYALMMGGEDGTLENARARIAPGDFVTLYTSSDSITSENDLYYAAITGYDAATGEISYRRIDKQEILDSADLYTRIRVSGDDLVTEEEREQLEARLLEQIQESSFAEEAACLLADMVTKTDGLVLLSLGTSFELCDDVKLRVELITSGDQLHFGDSVQLTVKVDATFEVEASEGKVAIDLSATFVEEVALSPMVRGSIVTKEILFIPVPVGVEVSAAIDIRNYTAFSFAADIYTVAPEEENTWDKVKNILNDPTEVLGLPGIPEELQKGMKSLGDVMDKIDEFKKKIDEAGDSLEQIKGYKEDMEALWAVVEGTGLTTRKDWEQMGEALGKTSVAADLMDMMNLTTETEITAEYLDSMQELMDKYSEMLEKETGWVELVNEEIYAKEFQVKALVIGVETNFIVRADMSIAIGSNLEYEVGKRFNFWFKIGLFEPTAGSSAMDLIDERFAFQFYVMGRLGLKAGVRAKLYVGLGSGKFASVGIAAEVGPYVKLYGFFVYEYTRQRPAHTQIWIPGERMAGALYLEFGMYFMLSFEANALGELFEYSFDFMDKEWKLLEAGEPRYYYNNAYEPAEDESVIVRDQDGNGANGITMVVPDSCIALSYVDLPNGLQGSEALDYSRYHFTVSNPNFAIDPDTGVISVTLPDADTRYMECDLTVTYMYGKLAFSRYDMTVTVPLVWTNLSTAELNEYYTASVRVGNDADGYSTVWRQRVRKNQPFGLPSDAEVRAMLGWENGAQNLKYAGGAGYGGQGTEGLTLIEDRVFDYRIDYKTYSVTVDGIQNADGSTRSASYTAKYGECFDFSDLEASGTDSDGVYTKFAGVKTNATVSIGGREQAIDLSQPVSGKAAEVLGASEIHATAEYADDSVAVRFVFTGLNHEDVTQRIRKGSVPSLAKVEAVAAENALAIKDISPDVGRADIAEVYQVVCGELDTPRATIVFHENGGSDVADITKPYGSLVGPLPEPVRDGYVFCGWYTDDGTFQNPFEEKKMPEGGAQLYARWAENQYTVTFHVNGGNELEAEESTKTIAYGQAYGPLPEPDRNGYGFVGWFTQAEGGEEVTAQTKVSVTGDQTLYAHWGQLVTIPREVFDFGEPEGGVYSKGTAHEVLYAFNPGELSLAQDGFTLKYMRQGDSDYAEGLPVNAGTYNVTVSRPADGTFAKFEQTYTEVITIDKAVRTIGGAVAVEACDRGYTYLGFMPVGDGGIDDLGSEAVFTYTASDVNGNVISGSSERPDYVYDLLPEQAYVITVTVTKDQNYEDATAEAGTQFGTLEAPSDEWADYADTSWYSGSGSSFTLETAAQLAGLASLVNLGNNFSGKAVRLGTDIDLTGHKWSVIGTGLKAENGWAEFQGSFDGGNRRITGLYLYDAEGKGGLFGTVSGNARVENTVVDHSYIRGGEFVGGIVSSAGDNALIKNCVNYASVFGNRLVGGIIGFNMQEGVQVMNCVNYGAVTGTTEDVGGIAGRVRSGKLINNANYGAVSGGTQVGGIVGLNWYAKKNTAGKIYNNFSVGSVTGTGGYLGAVVGRNQENKGDIHQCYYLQGSASCNGSYQNAAGTQTGSLNDGDGGTKTAYFTSPDTPLSRVCEDGTDGYKLIDALNAWAVRCKETGAAQWTAKVPGGYPIPTGSAVRTTDN